MRLKIFNFVDKVIEQLEEIEDDLLSASKLLEVYFEETLQNGEKDYMNLISRIKTTDSLREKILRNGYYKKYEIPHEVIENLSDLIGIRIECRFIEDEKIIYKYLKKIFNVYDSKGYYYNSSNNNVFLQLESNQPEEQKNGFKIYRIDGKYKYNNRVINFELQIKSIVNMFWGDIEHKIIYKNYNYMINDNFFKEIMGSIKNSLSMIDNQLLVIDNYFNGENTSDDEIRKEQIESLLSKILYDVFSKKMKENLGFIVDFRKACYIIIKYIVMKSSLDKTDNYNRVLLNILGKLNEIGETDVNFNSEIVFDRKPIFKDEFSEIIGNKVLVSINEEIKWNLFFKILFAIESSSNEEDFESFVEFIRDMFKNSRGFLKLDKKFSDESKFIKAKLMREIAVCFNKVDIIDFLYEDNIIKVNECIEEICDLIIKNIDGYRSFIKYQDIYYGLLEFSILSVFGNSVKSRDAMDFIEKVKNKSNKIIVSNEVLKYINTLESLEEVSADDILAIFKV